MDGYISEVRMFGGNFAPLFWLDCDGSLLSIANVTPLFALIGTTYGGDGQTNFAVPDLRGRTPISPGTGAGLPFVNFGEQSGLNSVTLTTNNMPAHNHAVTGGVSLPAVASAGNLSSPTSVAVPAATSNAYHAIPDGSTMAGTVTAPTLASAGSGLPFDNRQPYLGIRFIICVDGIFPTRN